MTVLGLGAAGVLAQGWIVAEGLRGDIAWVVNLQSSANPLYRAWRGVLPDYLHESAGTWVLHWGWAIVALAVVSAAYRDARRGARPGGATVGCGAAHAPSLTHI